MSDELKVKLTTLPYQVVLTTEVQLNGLGEVVTMWCKDAALRGHRDLSDEAKAEMEENAAGLILIACKAAIEGYKEHVNDGHRDAEPVEAPVHPDDGREDGPA